MSVVLRLLGDVERVAALGKQAHELAIAELAEAHGVVGHAGDPGHRAVPRGLDRVYHRLVEPDGPDVPGVVHHAAAALWVLVPDGGRRGRCRGEERLPPPQVPVTYADRDTEEDEGEEDERRGGGCTSANLFLPNG